jgi:hypothetical protein
MVMTVELERVRGLQRSILKLHTGWRSTTQASRGIAVHEPKARPEQSSIGADIRLAAQPNDARRLNMNCMQSGSGPATPLSPR